VNALVQAFLLGNASILTNVCLLPLYPGLLAFLAGTGSAAERTRGRAWLGLVVLAGVLSTMVVLGLALYALGKGFEAVLPWLLPAVYIAVIGLGLAMLAGRNPFAGLVTGSLPTIEHPMAAAFVYGALIAPVTLPCTGPVLISFLLVGSATGESLGQTILTFVAFGLGFGWPLVVLGLVASPVQRQFTGWLVAHHQLITRAAGVLLVVIGVWGLRSEVLPALGW